MYVCIIYIYMYYIYIYIYIRIACCAMRHPEAEIMWVQEEPKNMGPWSSHPQCRNTFQKARLFLDRENAVWLSG